MTRILLLNSGPHSDVSHGYRLAMEAIAASGIDNVQITERDLVKSPIPPIDRDYAIAVTSQTTPDAKEFVWSERLIVELEQHEQAVDLARFLLGGEREPNPLVVRRENAGKFCWTFRQTGGKADLPGLG